MGAANASAAVTHAVPVSNTAACVLFSDNPGGCVGRYLWNNSTQTLYVQFGTGAAAGRWTYKVAADGWLAFPAPVYSGVVTGLWAGADASGAARMSETFGGNPPDEANVRATLTGTAHVAAAASVA